MEVRKKKKEIFLWFIFIGVDTVCCEMSEVGSFVTGFCLFLETSSRLGIPKLRFA